MFLIKGVFLRKSNPAVLESYKGKRSPPSEVKILWGFVLNNNGKSKRLVL